MGTASFSVGKYATGRGSGAASIQSGELTTSGAFTTSTSADFLEDAGGDITMAAGQILIIHADEAMRIRFGGSAATATVGHYIPAGIQKEYECSDAGKVSIIDVA